MNDATVLKSTRKRIDEWVSVIRTAGFIDATHKEIADFLHDTHELTYWWAQEVTVECEKRIGRRILGQTADGKFQIGVSKTIDAAPERIWSFFESSEGVKLLFGDSGDVRLSPELEGKSSDGIDYRVTTFKSGSHFRAQWRLSAWPEPSILQLRVTGKNDGKSTVSFHQEKLPDAKSRDVLKKKWRTAAQKIADTVGT